MNRILLKLRVKVRYFRIKYVIVLSLCFIQKKLWETQAMLFFLFVNSPWCFFFFSSSLLLRREGKAQKCFLTVWVPRLAHLETPLRSDRSILAHRQPPNPKQVLPKQQMTQQWCLHGSQILQQAQMSTLPSHLYQKYHYKPQNFTCKIRGVFTHTLPLMWYMPSFATDVSPETYAKELSLMSEFKTRMK